MAISTGAPVSLGNQRTSTDMRAMSIATALFFMWGFLTCLNDILIPHLKAIFDLNYAQAMLIQMAFFGAYFLFALPAGKIVDWLGYKQAMVVGLVVAAAGTGLFLPAASAASYGLFLAAQVMLAAGITVLQVAANPYVTSLGPVKTASSRLNFSQAFNSLGTTIAPRFGAIFILGAAQAAAVKITELSGPALQAYRAQQASTVRMPYLGMTLTLLALAVALGVLKMPPMLTANRQEDGKATSDSIWHHPWLLMGAACIFLYVGAEVSIGSFLVNYFGLPQIMKLAPQEAANYVTYYWGGAMVGRFIGSAVLQRVRTGVLLGIVSSAACVLVLTSMLTSGHTAMWTIIAVGLFNSVMFPNIFTLGLHNLGELTSKGSSLLVMAIVGGALIPEAEGLLADRVGVQHAFILPALCYVAIAGFGFAARNLGTGAEPVLSAE